VSGSLRPVFIYQIDFFTGFKHNQNRIAHHNLEVKGMGKRIIPIFIASILMVVLASSCAGKKTYAKQKVNIKPVKTFRIVSIKPQGRVCIDDEKNRFIKIRFSCPVSRNSIKNKIQIKERCNNGSLNSVYFDEKVQKDAKELVITLWEVPILYPCQLIISPGIKSQTGLPLADTANSKKKIVTIRYYTNDKNIGDVDVISFFDDYGEPEFDQEGIKKAKAAQKLISTLNKIQKDLSEMQELQKKAAELEKRSRK